MLESCDGPLDKGGPSWYNRGEEVKKMSKEYPGTKIDITGWVMADHGAPQRHLFTQYGIEDNFPKEGENK